MSVRTLVTKTGCITCMFLSGPIKSLKIYFDASVSCRPQNKALTEALIRAGIPYYVTRGKELLETAAVMDALAYLRLILDTRDDSAFQRVINKPPRAFGTPLFSAGIQKSSKDCLVVPIPECVFTSSLFDISCPASKLLPI